MNRLIATSYLIAIALMFAGSFGGTYVARKITDHQYEAPEVTDQSTQVFIPDSVPEPLEAMQSAPGASGGSNNQGGSFISWRGEANPGASPVTVLRATKEQMEREQKTKLGSDATARAMVLVMQAIAELEGKQTEMPDGTPIIQ
jgi:uncharacterized protein YneF (UPF0154 family)